VEVCFLTSLFKLPRQKYYKSTKAISGNDSRVCYIFMRVYEHAILMCMLQFHVVHNKKRREHIIRVVFSSLCWLFRRPSSNQVSSQMVIAFGSWCKVKRSKVWAKVGLPSTGYRLISWRISEYCYMKYSYTHFYLTEILEKISNWLQIHVLKGVCVVRWWHLSGFACLSIKA